MMTWHFRMRTLSLMFLAGAMVAPAVPVRVGILSQPDFPKAGAPSDPAYLAELLKGAGYEPVILGADDLLNTCTLDAAAMPVVVLPYGPVFPGEAAKCWQHYLHQGGSFFSTGGYAFDEPVFKRAGQWLTWNELVDHDPKWLVNGEFKDAKGWTVTGDVNAARFGPDPSLGGKPGLIVGYPFETTYKSGGKETSVTVRQSLDAPPAGRYEIRCTRYLRWLAGDGELSMTLTTLDAQDKAIKETRIMGAKATPGMALGPVSVKFEVPSQTKRIEIALSMDKMAGQAGFSGMQILRRPPGRDINSHYGESMDGMTVPEESVTTFDSSFPLRFAAFAEADEGQVLVPRELKIDGPLEGWVADAMVGSTSRLQPLIKARDRYGRPRGAVGSLVYHYGRFFPNSVWAIYGVTNKDLFARGDEAMAKVFVGIIGRLVERVYLVNPHAEWPCYRDPASTITLLATVMNQGAESREVTVRTSVFR